MARRAFHFLAFCKCDEAPLDEPPQIGVLLGPSQHIRAALRSLCGNKSGPAKAALVVLSESESSRYSESGGAR
jgi:hypothetical protein